MSLILGQTEWVCLELLALELVKNPIFVCIHSKAYHKYLLIMTKLGQNIYGHKISDEFYFESDRIDMS